MNDGAERAPSLRSVPVAGGSGLIDSPVSPGEPARRRCRAGRGAAVPAAQDARTAFRPCIDPDNLPFANDKGEGFENRIAELFARQARLAGEKLRVPAAHEFHSQHAALQAARRRLPLRHRDERALPASTRCRSTAAVLPFDLRARVSQGQGPRPGRRPAPTSSRCRPMCASKLRIGIYDNSPASGVAGEARDGSAGEALSRCCRRTPTSIPARSSRRIWRRARSTPRSSGARSPAISRSACATWSLAVIPLRSEPGVKFDYEIAMGVRYGEREWKATVDKLIAENQAAITAILREYDVPLVDRARRADQLGAGLHTPVRLAPENTDANAISVVAHPLRCPVCPCERLPDPGAGRIRADLHAGEQGVPAGVDVQVFLRDRCDRRQGPLQRRGSTFLPSPTALPLRVSAVASCET